jgi:hypothetical protein
VGQIVQIELPTSPRPGHPCLRSTRRDVRRQDQASPSRLRVRMTGSQKVKPIGWLLRRRRPWDGSRCLDRCVAINPMHARIALPGRRRGSGGAGVANLDCARQTERTLGRIDGKKLHRTAVFTSYARNSLLEIEFCQIAQRAVSAHNFSVNGVFLKNCAPMCGRCWSNAHQHSRDVLRDRFLAPRKIVAHVAPAPGRRHDPTISPYASCCSSARPFPPG